MPADAFKSKPSTDPLAIDIAMDQGSDGKFYQLEQPSFGPDGGAKTMIGDADGFRLPVGGAQIGPTNEAPAGSDTATSGLNGLLKRIAQNITQIVNSLSAGIKRADAYTTVTIAAAANLSTAADIRGYKLTGIITDTNFDGTSVSFQVSPDGVNYWPLYDANGVLVALTGMAISRAFSVWSEAAEWSYVKINCVTVQAGSTTTLTLQLKS